MNKELEAALQKFLDEYLTLCEKLHTNQQEKMLLDKNSPYNVLKKYLESIDNAKPSEALEELEQDIKGRVILAEDRQLKLCAVIKQALLKSQEMEKVLEIIKERQVDVFHLMRSETVEEYNKIWDSSKYCLTQEEFELLKAYFGKNIQK